MHHMTLGMPTLARFGALRIAMYAEDHNPPHLHVLGPDLKVLVEIGTWRILARYGRTAAIAPALA
jgi:Domain of unknown function (DUF4160)